MAFFLCGSKNQKFQSVYLGTYGNANISMAALGYTPSQYTKWTTNNFSYTVGRAGASARRDSQLFIMGDADHIDVASNSSFTPPSLSYNPSTGILTVYAGTITCYGVVKSEQTGDGRQSGTGSAGVAAAVYLKAVL